MNLWKHLSRRPVMPRVLNLTDVDRVGWQIPSCGQCHIIIPGWRLEVLLSRLGDWDVGSAGCATTPMVRMSTGDHGPSWACATRPSRSVATPKYQSARHQSAQAAFSCRMCSQFRGSSCHHRAALGTLHRAPPPAEGITFETW